MGLLRRFFLIFNFILPWLNRLSRLVDEEIEADEEFWNQDAFKEVRFCLPFQSLLNFDWDYLLRL